MSVHEGYLLKYKSAPTSAAFSPWVRRYFVLDADGYLSYYNDDADFRKNPQTPRMKSAQALGANYRRASTSATSGQDIVGGDHRFSSGGGDKHGGGGGGFGSALMNKLGRKLTKLAHTATGSNGGDTPRKARSVHLSHVNTVQWLFTLPGEG
jgi:hypothetical protein